ncbi:MAG: hypothetical protein AAB152_10090 [Candidatus Coatesbacteria bacterium]
MGVTITGVRVCSREVILGVHLGALIAVGLLAGPALGAAPAAAPMQPQAQARSEPAVSIASTAFSPSGGMPALTASATGGEAAAPVGTESAQMPGEIQGQPVPGLGSEAGMPDGGGPPPPEALVAIGADKSVNLSWLPSPAPGILGYNVYRSTEEGVYGPVPVNRSLVTGTEFSDTEGASTGPPENGLTYYYTVRGVDEQGRLSTPSEEGRARPEGAVVISEIPKVEYGFGESQLSVSGRKVVSLGYTIRTPKNSPGTSQISGAQNQRLDLQQQLQVRLMGTVGKKITVDVDYDDTAPETTRQRIQVVYQGEPQETIERAEFGDINLQLSDTEFTGYNKTLFGVRLQARPLERLKVTGVATQTQGINASEQFVGTASRQKPEFFDYSYVANRYFYITNPAMVKTHLGIKPGSEQVWLDDGLASNDVPGVTMQVGTFHFDPLYQGVDYSIDYATGVLTFNRTISNTAAIAVSFTYGDGLPVNFGGLPGARINSETLCNLKSNWDITTTFWADTTGDAHLIFDGPHTGAGDAHMITNWYQLGFRNIVPKDFDAEFTIRVYDSAGNEVLGIINPLLDSDFYDFGVLKVLGAAGRGGHPRLSPDVSSPYYDPAGHYTSYPNRALGSACGVPPNNADYMDAPATEQPFAWDAANQPWWQSATKPGGNAYGYGTMTRFSSPRYKLVMSFLVRATSFRLKNISIVRGSERVTMDGRVLMRDVDYFIDYDFGNVTFLRPEQIRYDSRIQIDYEYLPFGGQFQSFLWGARAQYAMSERSGLGVTYLSNAAQNPQDVPSPSAAPKATSIAGLDGRTFLSRGDLSEVLRVLPGFQRAVVPLEMEIRGEVARSNINPNSYDPSGVAEKGVAMIDSMEGVDDVIDAGSEASSWFPGSAPETPTTSQANRTAKLAWKTEQGGHFSDLARTLDLNYEGLGPGQWEGLRYVLSPVGLDLTNYQYLEMWVYGDNSNNMLSVSLGVVSEDGNGNAATHPALDTEDLNGDFVLNAGEDTGINHDGSPFWGGNGVMTINGTGYPGPGGTLLNTEDMNGNGVLDTRNQYFEYRMRVSWTGWNYVKIPLSFTSLAGDLVVKTEAVPNLTVTFAKTPDAPDKSVIRHMRIWLQGDASGAHPSGKIRIESLGVTGNRWVLRTTPGSTLPVDNTRFNVSAISEETAAEYVPLLTYYQVRETDAERREQALKLDYNLYDDLGGNYFASRAFPTPVNLLDYEELRLDVFKAHVFNENNGEILFLRAGGDDSNYFQFNVPLDHIGPGWQTVVINLRDQRNRARVGTPTLSGVRQFAIGVIRYDPAASAATESLWINNIRLVTPAHKTGIARKVNVRMSTPMGSTFIVDPNQEILPANAGIILDTTYRELDNDFRLLDQAAFIANDQHRRSIGSNLQIRQIPKLPITGNWQHDVAYVESSHRDDPVYFFSPDTQADSYQVTVSSQHLAPVSVDVSANRSEQTVAYLTGVAGADYNRVTWSAQPQVRAPLDGNLFRVIPLGSGGEARASARYTKDRTNYGPSEIFKNLVDRTSETLDEQYDARTTYHPLAVLKKLKVPILPGYATSPRAGYHMNRTRGIIGSLQVANIENPNSINSAGRFVPVLQDVSAGLDNRIDGMKGVTPSSNWNGKVSRDFTRANLASNSMLTNNLDLRPGEWWKALIDQSFNLGYTIETSGTYNDVTQTTGTKTVVIDPVTRRVPLRDLWWIDRKNDNLSAANSFAETYVAGGRMVFLRALQFTPNWSFRESTLLQQKLRTRTTSTTAGTGFSLTRHELITKFFGVTPLFWMKFDGLESTYNFRKATTFDFRDQPTNITENHNATGSMGFSPVKNLSGNVSMSADVSMTRIPPVVKTIQRSLQPSASLSYSKSAGLDIPLIWWRLKLTNLFTIRHNFRMNFINNEAIGQTFGNRKAQELQDFTEFEYEMLKGINLRFRAQFDQVKDFTTPISSFKAFSFFGTFMFNF